MEITTSLYEGKLICLGPIDHEKDPVVESKWTHNPEYLRQVLAWPSWPASPERIKKRYEALEKAMEEEKNLFHFAVRLRAEAAEENDRLLGFARLSSVEWANGHANQLSLAIADPADRRKGYGSEALSLLLRFAFAELNLHRVTARIPEHNAIALAFFQKFGFVEEIRRRKALRIDGNAWDEISMGLLQREWRGCKA
ncbi:MAG: GNAT family N-acetyltransferase [Chloroflexota bacterium]